MRILDLGCGYNKVEGAVGLDNVALSEVDIAHYLLDFPYPIENESYDIIFNKAITEMSNLSANITHVQNGDHSNNSGSQNFISLFYINTF